MDSLPLRSLLALALVLFAGRAPLFAQTTGNVEVRTEGSEKGAKGEAGSKSEKGAAEDGSTAGDGSTAEPSFMNPAMLANFAFGHVTTRPRRLAPGESGTLSIVVTLNTPAVVPGGSAVTLDYQLKQKTLELGNYTVLPPKAGTLETKFKGQPVYDNTLTIEIPLTISPQAARGDAPVTLQVKTSLVNGSSGQVMGELQLPVNGRVVVGRSVPRPLARGDDGATAAASVTASELLPTPAPEPIGVTATPRDNEAVKAPVAATMTATNHDGVGLEVVFPTGTNLPVGGRSEAQVRVSVPSGVWLSRASAEALTLEVSGADEGVLAAVAAWPEATPPGGSLKIPVSGDQLSVPVALAAGADATPGLRHLEFRLTYSTVGPDGVPSAAQTLLSSAVLSVGPEPTVANPWLFYTAGGALALLLAVLVLRATRK